MLISIIISTYNWPEALERVLVSLNGQHNAEFEVIVADDGSDQRTAEMLQTLGPSLHFPLQHVWQEDMGFRVGAIRNKAIAQSRGDYIIFLDQDCVVGHAFIENHLKHARSEYFVSFSRVLVDKHLTDLILSQGIDLAQCDRMWLLKQFLAKHLNKVFYLVPLKLGPLRYTQRNQWQGAKCLLGAWKKDLLAVNGFDETYSGWGHEDSDLVVRLLQSGVKRKSAKFGTEVFHLYHTENSRESQGVNWQRLQDRINGLVTDCQGVDQYL